MPFTGIRCCTWCCMLRCFCVLSKRFHRENICPSLSMLFFAMLPGQRCLNKHTQKQVRSLASAWNKATSNPVVFSYVGLSQFTEQSWQTPPHLSMQIKVIALHTSLCCAMPCWGVVWSLFLVILPRPKCRCNAQAGH